jgi:dTDP-4-amino-4,6-dideoxygalactose transaminase
MTDIQAAVGLVQLSQLDTFVQRRRSIAALYSQAFDSLGLRLPPPDKDHIFYRYVVGLGTDAKPWIHILREQGIGCARPVYLPLHNHLKLKGYHRSEKAWQQALSIPIYPSLSKENVDRVIETFIQILGKAVRHGKI